MAQKQRIYFDIDDTLIMATLPNGQHHPLMEPAWQRLEVACRECLPSFPQDFNWSAYKGSTDFAVVSKIVEAVTGSRSLPLILEIINKMNQFYLYHGEKDLTPALFPDTTPGLQRLIEEGYELGIVTGNAWPVAKKKLQNASIIDFFPNEKLWFTGDNPQKPTRAHLLLAAYIRNVRDFMEENGIQPLFYVADSIGDQEACEILTNLTNQRYFPYINIEVRLLLRSLRHGQQSLREKVYYSDYSYKEKDLLRIYFFNKIMDSAFKQALELPWRFPTVEGISRYEWRQRL